MGGAPSSGPSGFRRWEPSPFRTLSGGCLSLHWQAWRDRGAEPWVVEVLRLGYCLPFLSTPPLSNVPIPMPSSSPTSIKGAALEEVTLGLIAMGAVGLAPLTSPGFYSHLFVVWKTSRSWRPVIDLSHLIRFVDVSPFQMETIQSVLLAVRQGDWMASIDLMEAYLQVPVPQLLVTFFASCSVTLSITSKRCALASPRLRRSSPGSWLLFQLYSILWGSV